MLKHAGVVINYKKQLSDQRRELIIEKHELLMAAFWCDNLTINLKTIGTIMQVYIKTWWIALFKNPLEYLIKLLKKQNKHIL